MGLLVGTAVVVVIRCGVLGAGISEKNKMKLKSSFQYKNTLSDTDSLILISYV